MASMCFALQHTWHYALVGSALETQVLLHLSRVPTDCSIDRVESGWNPNLMCKAQPETYTRRHIQNVVTRNWIAAIS